MEDKYALLIDADNVSAKYIKPILDELSKYGITIRESTETGPARIIQATKGYRVHCSDPAVRYTHGKNPTDSHDYQDCNGYAVYK